MKTKSLILALVCSSILLADGAEVFEKKCASCHTHFVPVDALMENFMKGKNTLLALKGPSLNQLNFRLKQMIGEPNGDAEFHKMEVVEFIKDYVIDPDLSKSVCLEEVISNFETMPSLRGKISEEELEMVSEWIYDYLPPEEQK